MNKNSNFYKGKKVLITGGAGAIGSNLTKVLANHDAQVIVIDNLSSAERWNIPNHPNILFVESDIVDEVALKRVFFEKPDIVYHLAAFFANQNSVDHPEHDLKINGLGTLKLLEYAALTGVQRFVYASSGCSIYGSNAPLPLKEEFMSMNLSTPYQITKMVGELYCNFFYNHYGLKVVKTRFFNSYGPGEIPGQYRNVIPNFIFWAMKRSSLPITGSGEETRDFTFVNDIVDGLLKAGYMENAIGQEFNLASGREIKIIDLANMINTSIGNNSGVRYVTRRKWDTKNRVWASINRAQNLIDYNPKTDFKEGLNLTIQWFKNNWNRIEKSADFSPGTSAAVRQMTSEKSR